MVFVNSNSSDSARSSWTRVVVKLLGTAQLRRERQYRRPSMSTALTEAMSRIPDIVLEHYAQYKIQVEKSARYCCDFRYKLETPPGMM
jgi:hypothetical protein